MSKHDDDELERLIQDSLRSDDEDHNPSSSAAPASRPAELEPEAEFDDADAPPEGDFGFDDYADDEDPHFEGEIFPEPAAPLVPVKKSRAPAVADEIDEVPPDLAGYRYSTTTSEWSQAFTTEERARVDARARGCEDIFVGKARIVAYDVMALGMDALHSMGYTNRQLTDEQCAKVGAAVAKAIAKVVGPPVRIEDLRLIDLAEDIPPSLAEIDERFRRGYYADYDALAIKDIALHVNYRPEAITRAVALHGLGVVLSSFLALQQKNDDSLRE